MGERGAEVRTDRIRTAVAWICLLAGGAFVFWFLESRRCVSANNDAFLQILASEGLLSGEGYGFRVNERFISLGQRRAITRWPPGLTIIASALEVAGGRTLEFLSAILPLCGLISFGLLARIGHKAGLSLLDSCVAALCVAATGVFHDWHTEVGTEPLFLIPVLAVIGSVNGEMRAGLAPAMAWMWWAGIMRTAAGYLAIGLGAMYGHEAGKDVGGRVVKIFQYALLFCLPLGIFHLYYGISAEPAANAKVGFVAQAAGHLYWMHEVLAPHTTVMKQHRLAGMFVGFVVFTGITVMAWTAYRRCRTCLNPTTASAVLASAYSAGLTISGWWAGYDWASVYRVSGVAVVLFSVSFWTGALKLARRGLKVTVITLATLVCTTKIVFLLSRYEPPAFQRDYRATTAALESHLRALGGRGVLLCAGDSFERNVSYAILYAVRHGLIVPADIHWLAFGKPPGQYRSCWTLKRGERFVWTETLLTHDDQDALQGEASAAPNARGNASGGQ